MQLLADLFPAEVTLPDQRVYRRARVIITEGETVVLAEQHGQGGHLVHRASHAAPPDLMPLPGMRRIRATVHGADGDLYVRQLSSCRCHGATLLSIKPEDVLSER